MSVKPSAGVPGAQSRQHTEAENRWEPYREPFDRSGKAPLPLNDRRIVFVCPNSLSKPKRSNGAFRFARVGNFIHVTSDGGTLANCREGTRKCLTLSHRLSKKLYNRTRSRRIFAILVQRRRASYPEWRASTEGRRRHNGRDAPHPPEAYGS